MRTISFGGVVIFCFISLVWGQVQRVCGPNNKVIATETIIDSEVIWMQWMGKNNKVVYAWSQLYTLYRSTDEGKTWSDQTDKFDGVKNFYYIQPTANESKLYFPTAKPPHYRVWTSSDEGASLTELRALADYGIGCAVYYILPHPSEQDVALLYGQSVKCTQASSKQCYNEVHFTRNFGKTWTLLDTYVDQVSWGKLIRDDDGNVIHMYVLYTAFMEKKGVQDRISRDKLAFVRNDLIKPTSGQVLYQGVSHMLKSPDNDSYLYLSETTSEGKQLLVSEDDGETFVIAKFPLELEENGYTILDDTDGSVFVNVQHNDGSYGNIYISDDFGYSFGLSLKNNKKSYSYYTFYGGCDFEKMKGLDGIYVANVFDQSGSQVTTNIKTMITYDMGGVWSRLLPPVNDSRGQPINCVGDCYLNLFGINELVYGRFYSVPNSVALMVATGNVGSYLERRNDYVNAYISRDAGFSWIELGKGSFTYEISEHGSLLLYAKNTEETNEIYYTWNEGLTNETCVFSDRVMDVTNIVVEPTFTSKQFFLYGSRGGNGVIVHIDLSALHPAACKSPEKAGQPDSDYERWSPSDAGYADEAKECILGAHTVYARKKQTSRCFNPPDFNPVLSVTPCECVREDYDCDFCFEPADDGTCVLACEDYDPTAAPTECGSYYYASKGYRLISGTRCQGGLDLRPVKTTCPGYNPNTGSGSKGGLSGGAIFAIIIIFLASIALAAIVGIFLVMKFEKPEFIYEKLKDIKLFQRNPGRTKGSSYFHVGQDKEVESPFLVDDSVN